MRFRVLDNKPEEDFDPLEELTEAELVKLLSDAEKPFEEHWPDGTIVREIQDDIEYPDSFVNEIREEIKKKARK